MDSIDQIKPNEQMSNEFIILVLKYNKIESLTRWIAQKKLTFSYEGAKLIETHAKQKSIHSKKLFELALYVYTHLNSVFEMAACMAMLGRYSVMMNFITSHKQSFTKKDSYLRILHLCPSLELANLIVDTLTKNMVILKDSKRHNRILFFQ